MTLQQSPGEANGRKEKDNCIVAFAINTFLSNTPDGAVALRLLKKNDHKLWKPEGPQTQLYISKQ